jgi:hypothetical protein
VIGMLKPEFVEFIPDKLEDGKLYISETYATASHKCCCGCGNRVITPLSSTGWRLFCDGEYVTLYPSIGNWSFPCQSHYWIRRNVVRWSYQMSQEEIDAGRRHDATFKSRYFDSCDIEADTAATYGPTEIAESPAVEGPWERLKKWLLG